MTSKVPYSSCRGDWSRQRTDTTAAGQDAEREETEQGHKWRGAGRGLGLWPPRTKEGVLGSGLQSGTPVEVDRPGLMLTQHLAAGNGMDSMGKGTGQGPG